MMLSLSASHPTVSATRRTAAGLRRADRLHDRFVDALDEIVALLVELVDRALGARDLMVVLDARLVLLVPQLDVRLREPGDQLSDGLRHPPLLGWTTTYYRLIAARYLARVTAARPLA